MPEGQLYFRPSLERIYVEIGPSDLGTDYIETRMFMHGDSRIGWAMSLDHVARGRVIRIEDDNA